MKFKLCNLFQVDFTDQINLKEFKKKFVAFQIT